VGGGCLKITINDEERNVKDDITIAELLENEGYNKWAIVWVNEEHIFMKYYHEYTIKDEDKVNINDALVYG
jgi:thiamine biosynthesis protein ThiS